MNSSVIISSLSPAPAVHSKRSIVPPGPVEIGIVLDQSESMSGSIAEVIAGYNALLDEQRALSKETRVSLTLFNSAVQVLYQGKPIMEAAPLNKELYRPAGSTALYDGIMTTVNGLVVRVDALPEPPRVVVAILSDGGENASTHYKREQVKETIRYWQSVGWQFLFLGPHASKTAYALGFPFSNALPITASREGIKNALGKLKSALTNIRLGDSTDVFRLK